MESINQAKLQGLLDKQDIEEQLMRYARAIDRQDPALLRTVYWPDAYDDHLLYEGDVDGLVEWAFGFTDNMPTHHFVGNRLIELQSETEAFSEAYYVAWHDMPPEPGSTQRMNLALRGRYLDTFEKRGDEWRIKRRILALDAYTLAPGTSDWEAGHFAKITTRGGPRPDDPLYTEHPNTTNN
ncbi:nuclear transport factor 2 family protein [Halioglobus maricola]|uniref:Nuclear transport factor 2 family protein n=1 Tax=Halioglobus maricola TaxID=2601894 RepID=A0A5P9NMZ1_9GAMM|nr:nuclear transport factor 2 family protein [Halioglobus maricola]QFU77190.1 nuclear transport factor 2 family protein [Halioglobus maricola]